MSNIAHCNQILDIPVGHAVVNFGPVMDREGNQKEGWIFGIGYSENYYDPGTKPTKEEYDSRETYIIGIKLRTPEQAEAYARQFAKMAEEMRKETASKAEDSNESL